MGKKSKRNKNKEGKEKTVASSTCRGHQGNLDLSLYRRYGRELIAGDRQIPDDLLDAILSRGVRGGRINSRGALREFFLQILSCDWVQEKPMFVAHLVEGLTKGAPLINDNSIRGVDGPLLCRACQWKALSGMDWTAQDDLVDMMIKAGADVKKSINIASDILTVAIEFGTPQTVDLLLQADASILEKRYSHGTFCARTCLYNALLRPSVPIIRRLLEHFPANETFETSPRDGQQPTTVTIPDQIMKILVQKHVPPSWDIFGMPEASDVSEALMLFRLNGAHFTNASFEPLKMLARSLDTNIQVSQCDLQRVNMLRDVAKSLVGTIIPQAFIPDEKDTDLHLANRDGSMTSSEDTNDQSNNDQDMTICTICQSKATKKVTLYCGHSFCRKCIIDYSTIGNGEICPDCDRPLCLDLCNSLSGITDSRQRHRNVKNGPQLLTEYQVLLETMYKFGGYKSNLSPREDKVLRRKLIEASKVDCSRGEDKLAINPANDSHVAIDITIKDVPLLARISHRSLYTIVARNIVENLGLKRDDDRKTSKKLIHRMALDASALTCLKPFSLYMDGKKVTISTAMEATPDLLGNASTMFGIQLGRDFLYSGVWCPTAVDIFNGDLDDHTQKREMLRYHSHESEVATSQTFHFHQFDTDFYFGISILADSDSDNDTDDADDDDGLFEQCYWCCRSYPKGWMKACSTCVHANNNSGKVVTYCDEKCQRLAFKIHKRTHSKYHEEGQSHLKMSEMD